MTLPPQRLEIDQKNIGRFHMIATPILREHMHLVYKTVIFTVNIHCMQKKNEDEKTYARMCRVNNNLNFG